MSDRSNIERKDQKSIMIDTIAKWTVIIFGIFFICVGTIMLFKPQKAREILRKAGSTNFINYAEITLRMIPAAENTLNTLFLLGLNFNYKKGLP